MWLLQVWKAETIQTPYTEFDRCLLYCQLFNKALLWLDLVHRIVEAYATIAINVDPGASVLVIVRDAQGSWQWGLLGIYNMFGMLAQASCQYWV